MGCGGGVRTIKPITTVATFFISTSRLRKASAMLACKTEVEVVKAEQENIGFVVSCASPPNVTGTFGLWWSFFSFFICLRQVYWI